jgi:hypothetical protein
MVTDVIKGITTCPRWVGFPDFLVRMCHFQDLELEIQVRHRWLLWETVTFTIKGTHYQIEFARNFLDAMVARYNGDWNDV